MGGREDGTKRLRNKMRIAAHSPKRRNRRGRGSLKGEWKFIAMVGMRSPLAFGMTADPRRREVRS